MKKSYVVSTPYKKTIYFSVVLSLLFLVLFSFQSCQEVTSPETDETTTHLQKKDEVSPKAKEAMTKTLKSIARGLAILLESEDNRIILENSIKSSDKIEKILEASEFLNEMRSINVKGERKHITFREAISQVLPQNENTAFDEKIKSLDFGLIDLYFPIKEWRESWQSNNKLQIASVGWNEKLKKEEVFAFTSEGDEMKIPTNIKPTIATLVVYPSEKQGNYKQNEDNSQNGLSKSNSNHSTNTWYFDYKVTRVLVNKDYDSGWFGGDMEIFIKHRNKPMYYGSWSGWGETSTVDVEEDVLTNFNKTIFTNGNSPFIFNIQMLEWDGWFNGDDDLVCDDNYYIVTDENGNSGLSTTDIYNDTGAGDERELLDGYTSNYSEVHMLLY